MSVDHYENFPVASLLSPPALRPAVTAIYHFARTADDLADEGDAPAPQRLEDLAAYRRDLDAIYAGRPWSERWAAVFGPLRTTIVRHGLPQALLADLLSAFAQDVVQQRYADRAALVDYCRRSANPVGRLLLHLYHVTDSASLRRSDAICTGLQLANFWQDLSVDLARGRLYVPLADCAEHDVDASDLFSRRTDDTVGSLLGAEQRWARELLLEGAPLVHRIRGRAGWELRLVVQGGLRILEKTGRLGTGVLRTRPKLGPGDLPAMVWRALRMRRPPRLGAGAA